MVNKAVLLNDFANSLKPTDKPTLSTHSERPETVDVINGHILSDLSNTSETAKVSNPVRNFFFFPDRSF